VIRGAGGVTSQGQWQDRQDAERSEGNHARAAPDERSAGRDHQGHRGADRGDAQELELEDEGLELDAEHRIGELGAGQTGEREDQSDEPGHHPHDTAGAGVTGRGDPAVGAARLGDDRRGHHEQAHGARRREVVDGPHDRQPPTHDRPGIGQSGDRGGERTPEQTRRDDHGHNRHSRQDQGQLRGLRSCAGPSGHVHSLSRLAACP
jgi:hypothetical protein